MPPGACARQIRALVYVPGVREATEGRSKKTGRWSSDYDLNALYNAVADVARVAEPDFPESVSQRKWDDSRAAGGHPTAPSARQITSRLRLGWEDVKRIALDPCRSIEQTGAGLSKTSNKEERKRTPREIHYGLHLVARTLGRRSFSVLEYDRTRDELIAEERRRLGEQAILPKLLPTAYQITNSLAAGQQWNDALVSVGLEPHEQAVAKTALPLAEAFDVFVDTFEFRPTRNDLDWLRQQFGVSIAKIPVGKPWAELEAEFVNARAERGDETPAARMPKSQRQGTTIPEEVLAKLPRRTVKGKNTYEVCAGALVEYLESLGSDQRPTLHHYQQVAPAKGWPSSARITQHALWSEMLDAARQLRQTGQLPSIESVRRAKPSGRDAQLSDDEAEAASASQSSSTTGSNDANAGSSRKQSRKAA